ncbi:MAG: ArnT family glycosyltransferase [Desulfitobacteriia bacterium]|jgi:4-amino-4-deoxy-L-arabinose transferase-like glycosyltransferase
MGHKEKKVLFFIFTFLVVIRLYQIGVPPLEIEESWRQADTESMAWNFANYDFNPFRPNLNYDGPFPNIPALEIQVTTYLIAILYKIFGHHYFLARLVPLSFFLVSAWFLYLLARRHLSKRAAIISLLIYGILPVNVYYSRAIMPESAALMFWLGGIYYFDRGIEKRGKGLLGLSALFFSLALMTKPPVVVALIPMLYLCLLYRGRKGLKLPELWIYGLLIFALPAIYYYFSIQIAEYKFAVGITKDILWKEALHAFYSPEAGAFLRTNIPKTIGFLSLILTLGGLFFVRKKNLFLPVFLAAMVLEVILIVLAIRATYYLIFFSVPCALLSGLFLDRLVEVKGKAVLTVLIMGMMLESYIQVQGMFRINEVMAVQTQVVREVTAEDDLLVVGSFDPCVLSLTDRRGWRYNLNIYASLPEDPYQELDYYIERGAKYFIPIQGKVYGDEDGRLINYLERKFPKIEVKPGYPVYVLRNSSQNK